MKKKGAIELSIGTIVILVLSMSMLILGLILIRGIFTGATNIAKLSEEQISAEIAKVYGDEDPLVIYPRVDILEVKPGEASAFAIRVKNLLEGSDASNTKFSYETKITDFRDCGLNEGQILDWMKGYELSNFNIPPAGEKIGKVLIDIPEGSRLCTFKLIVNAEQNNQPYASTEMFIKIKA